MEGGRIVGEVARQPVGDRPDHRFSEDRIEVDVRISHRMLIAEGPVDPHGRLERGHVDRTVDVPRGIPEDLRISRRLEEGGQERVLRLQTEQQHDVRPVEQHREARFHLHRMNVLDAGGDARDLDEVAPHVPGHVGEVRDGRHDADLPRPGSVRREQRDKSHENVEETLHEALLTGHGSCGRDCP